MSNMDLDDDAEESHSLPKTSTSTLHAHRLDHNPSKLPAFRFVDLNRVPRGISSLLLPSSESESASIPRATKQGAASLAGDDLDDTTASTPLSPYSPTKRPSTSPGGSVVGGSYFPLSPLQSALAFNPRPQDRRLRRAPASHSSNGIGTATGPPPALSTQRSSATDTPRIQNSSTTEWALAQQQLTFQTLDTPATPIDDAKPTNNTRTPRGASRSLDESTSTRPLIPPIRSFRSSATRASLDMNAKSFQRFEAQSAQVEDQDSDRDRTLRALEGFSDGERNIQGSYAMDRDDQRQPDAVTEDLFLNLARDDADRQSDNGGLNFSRNERRRSRIALSSNRQSLPPVSHYQQSPSQPMSRRGSDLRNTSVISAEDAIQNQSTDRILYQPNIRDRSVGSSNNSGTDLHRSRYPPITRSFPSTPRGESHLLGSGRRSSIPDTSGSVTSRSHSYRQSNLSYSAPRVYNSSPLVARNKEIEDGHDVGRLAEGTESTTSTTAPSTVWDELDDLKSRIRKLELTGKLPATSGAAVSHATGERPPTATTTITTMSTSPKRGRGLSTSPIESNGTGPLIGEIHPLLHSALAKSKPLINSEVYTALENTASDALSIAAMTGSVGQPGIASSAQSVVGSGTSTLTDRQLRRKADSLCRSLTELCLALSEVRHEEVPQPSSQALVRPASRDREFQNVALEPSQRSSDGLMRAKSSPRAVSRLEARRSSLLATSSLPSPRYAPSEVSTPTQSAMAGRRTSILLRNRRAGTEEFEDDETRFRAPSRAATEIGRTRNSPREYTSQQPLPETRTPSVQSSLPLRRQYVSTNLNSSVPQSQSQPSPQSIPNPNPNLASRRFLDRSTPERDTNGNSVIHKLAEERGQRSSGLPAHVTESAFPSYGGRGLARAGSLNKDRRLRPQLRERSDTDASSTTQSQVGGYQ